MAFKPHVPDGILIVPSCILDTELYPTYEKLKYFYAEQLYFWNLSIQRLSVLKASSLTDHHSENYLYSPKLINEEPKKVETQQSDDLLYYCILCHLPVRGLASCCHLCGHVGHVKHIRGWFGLNRNCPVPGCNCSCYEPDTL